jgi:nucleoside-diphosphate-sugar epimerase
MRIFVAGGTGALGVPVVRQLISDGHTVIGLAKTRQRTSKIESLGAKAALADALDAEPLRKVVVAARPDVVVHALTAIPDLGPMRASDLDATNALRIKGTKNLLTAAIDVRARRFIAESMVFIYGFGDLGNDLLTESDAVCQSCPECWLQPALDALAYEEDQVLQAARAGQIEGLCLRFGGFYGPGTGTDRMAQLLRRRLLAIPRGALSRGAPWTHIEDAATAVVAALSRGNAGEVYNIVDDEPLPATEMLGELGDAIHAPKPWPIPMWFVRLAAPFAAAAWLNTTLRVSNAKAKGDLAWQPRFKTIREGLRDFAETQQ